MPAAPPASGFARLSLLAKLNLGILALCMIAVCALLWPAWRGNPDLSHGFFVPVVFFVLLHEARTSGARRWLPAGQGATFAGIAFLAAGLAALGAAGLFAAALGWSHALVNFMLVFALTLFLGAGLINFSTTTARLVPFNWSAVVAIGLWLLSAPMPLGTYTRLTLKLQFWVTETVLRALHLLGLAAHREGNIIELARGTVGVEEACSGVRSLVSCVFAALFFSASLVRRPAGRVIVVALAVPLALVMNFVRSLILTLLANGGVNISGAWHDLTGYAVLAVSSVLLGGLALLLERKSKTSAAPSSEPLPSLRAAQSGFDAALAVGLALAIGLVGFFAGNTHSSPRTDAPVPDLLAILPGAVPGWQVNTTTELYRFASRLKTDHLAQRTYAMASRDQPVQITVYLAYWRAGQASVSQVASHTPDACWPGSGWEAVPQSIFREQPTIRGRTLPTAETRLFKTGSLPQHVWFWHIYHGRPIAYENPYSPRALLQIAWRYGFRHDGDQLFVRVSSNVPWNVIADEPVLEEIFRQLQPLGL